MLYFSLQSFVVVFLRQMLSFDKHPVFLSYSSQGPGYLPTGKGSQMAKKNLSNIVAAKTIKVQCVLHAISSVNGTILISISNLLLLNPLIGLSPGWNYSKL